MGWAVEHTSCRNPGRVSASVRQPPPAESAPSTTVTDRPAPARVTAAARPFGPDPTTTTSAPSPAVIETRYSSDPHTHHSAHGRSVGPIDRTGNRRS